MRLHLCALLLGSSQLRFRVLVLRCGKVREWHELAKPCTHMQRARARTHDVRAVPQARAEVVAPQRHQCPIHSLQFHKLLLQRAQRSAGISNAHSGVRLGGGCGELQSRGGRAGLLNQSVGGESM